MKTRSEVAKIMDMVFDECRALREAGQKEYARDLENAFANFERVAERTRQSRENVLMVYLEKHLDGIHSWIGGHRSQREAVAGRINDAIVYLCLLRAMVEDGREAQGMSPLYDLPKTMTLTQAGPGMEFLNNG